MSKACFTTKCADLFLSYKNSTQHNPWMEDIMPQIIEAKEEGEEVCSPNAREIMKESPSMTNSWIPTSLAN